MSIFDADLGTAKRIQCVDAQQMANNETELSPDELAWVRQIYRRVEPGQLIWLPAEDGPRPVLLLSTPLSLWDAGRCAFELPSGHRYVFDDSLAADCQERLALGWALGSYRFDHYRQFSDEPARLVISDDDVRQRLEREVEAIFRVRDLVNTPAEDLGPDALAEIARDIALAHGADFSQTVGDQLLEENLPAIHAVGRASHRPPRLIDIRHGQSGPRITLVGKGVCFDTGGLNLKAATGMRDMKKDMGGAAHALALGQWIMSEELPVRLRILVPAVENSVGPDSYRPGDVVSTRAGISVEIGNTDAEGRIVLADALALAAEEKPDLIIDFATLTGSARIALGADLPALFARTADTANGIRSQGDQIEDPVWEMPLYAPYREQLRSNVADLCNIAPHSRGGNIVAALFLEHFVPAGQDWVHLDLWAWSAEARPGRPVGGHAQSLRAVFGWLKAYSEAA